MVNLPCSKHSENIINRKRGKLYIEAIPNIFFNSDFFPSSKKNRKKIDDFLKFPKIQKLSMKKPYGFPLTFLGFLKMFIFV